MAIALDTAVRLGKVYGPMVAFELAMITMLDKLLFSLFCSVGLKNSRLQELD